LVEGAAQGLLQMNNCSKKRLVHTGNFLVYHKDASSAPSFCVTPPQAACAAYIRHILKAIQHKRIDAHSSWFSIAPENLL
jgi:hypothetical protein